MEPNSANDLVSQLQQRISVLEKEIARLRMSDKQTSDLEFQIIERTEEMEQLNEELQSTNEELSSTNEELNNLNAKLDKSNTELNKYKSQLEELVKLRTEELQKTTDALIKQQGLVKCIEDSISHTFGEQFFEQIALNLAFTLHADYTFVGELANEAGDSITTISLCADNQIVPNITYNLEGTPCNLVFAKEMVVYPSGVSSLFPDDAIFQTLGIIGYIGVPLFSSKQEPVGIMVALYKQPIQDIETAKRLLQIFAGRVGVEIERRRIEISLKESIDKYKLLFNNMTNGFALHEIICDENNHPINYRYIEANPAFEKLTGLPAEKMIGKTVLEFLPNLEKEWIETYGRVALTGEPYRYENFSAELGKYYDVLAFCPKKNQFAVIFSDVTERKQLDKKLMEVMIQTEEKEREKLASNLHDEVGPILSSLNIYISSLAESDDKNKKAYVIPQMQNLIHETITTVRGISNDLSPHVLNSHGLEKAIAAYINHQNNIIPINFQSNLLNKRFAPNIESTFYRVIKELVNNSIKHSNATKISVNLDSDSNFLKLIYSDNGVGFKSDEVNHSSGGMGMMNIISRSKAINAKYTINTKPGQGFNFELSAPIV